MKGKITIEPVEGGGRSMKGKITIEPLQEFSSMGVATEILSQPAIHMVALGSDACIAALQHTARLMGAEARLFYKVLSPREYALGKNTREAVQLLNRAITGEDSSAYEQENLQEKAANISATGKTEMPRAVIVYCSCLDVLTHWEETEILSQVNNPSNIPVKFLYRGPLVKRRLLPRIALQKIWQELEYEPMKKEAREGYSDKAATGCPEINRDRSAIKDANTVEVNFKNTLLKHMGPEAIVLLTPGGCASCLFDVPPELRCKVYHTRFDDLTLVNLQPQSFVEAIEAYFPKSTPLLLLGTAVLKAVGLSLEEICDQLVADGYSCSL